MSQGLLYMGKGMLSVQPYYSERFLLSKVGMSGVVIFLTSLLDIKSTLLSKQHYFIYFLSLAMYPKFLFVVSFISNIGQWQTWTNASQLKSGSSCRCSGTGRQTQENNRFSDPYFASAYWKWRKSWTCYLIIHSNSRLRTWEYCHFKEKSRLCWIRKTSQENKFMMLHKMLYTNVLYYMNTKTNY